MGCSEATAVANTTAASDEVPRLIKKFDASNLVRLLANEPVVTALSACVCVCVCVGWEAVSLSAAVTNGPTQTVRLWLVSGLTHYG